MKVADNLDRHKISNKFEFWSDRTIDFGVTCPLTPKHPIYNLERSLLSFNWNFVKLADNLDGQKILDEFKFWSDRTIDFGELYFPLSAKKTHIRPCPNHSLFNFDCIFMKIADNLDRHKGLYEVEFRQDQTIHFGVICPQVPKKHIWLCPQHSLYNF